MKRDAKMSMLMADHVINMIKEKRAEEDKQLKLAQPDKNKDHPVKEAIQKFFNANPKAFGCERENVIKLMSALTGFDYTLPNACKVYYDQYSVITSLVDYTCGSLTTNIGTVLLVGSANGRVFTPSNIQAVTNQTVFPYADACPATDEQYAAFMKDLETEAGKKKLVTWMANSGLADTIFGLKLAE